MKPYRSILSLLLLTIFMAACKKYAIAPLVANPAYIRVFNDLNSTVDVLHSQQVVPFLTFVMDPKTDGAGVPNDGSIIGDYLGTRQLFSLSYPINEANSSTGITLIGNNGTPNPPILYPVNYEYPGNAHVLAAPVINGLDLSAWAQITSGKHRIMFVLRPQNGIAFKDLSSTIRGNILLDTTVDFQKGEVYTLEVVSRDLDNNKYGLYVRKEQFIHQAFDADKIYAGFTDLSGKTPLAGVNGFGFYFPDKIQIRYSYNIYNDAASNATNYIYTQLPGYNNNYYTTLVTKMDTAISYLPLPLLPQSSFFFQGLPRTYLPPDTYTNPFDGNRGSLPYFSFSLSNADDPVKNLPETFLLNSNADPNTINNYDTNNSTVSVKNNTPNLNLLINTGHAYHVYSSLNIMELVYDRVYMMQIQRGFDEVPQN